MPFVTPSLPKQFIFIIVILIPQTASPMQPGSAGGPDLSSKVHAESGTSPDMQLFASRHHTMGALLRRNGLEILVVMIFFLIN